MEPDSFGPVTIAAFFVAFAAFIGGLIVLLGSREMTIDTDILP